jgi:Epoxide hydrolase N terminus
MRHEGKRLSATSVSDEQLIDLRRRLAATRWPDKETVADQSQGVPLATIQQLAHYWQTDYDWRKVEARLNALPQFITGIDGLDIHFIHVRSRHENAFPLIVTHGWPGSLSWPAPLPTFRSWSRTRANTHRPAAGGSANSTTANLPTRRCTRPAFPATSPPKIATLSSPVTHLEGRT